MGAGDKFKPGKSHQQILHAYKTLIYSYSILTTEANELMSKIHNNKKRMPVVLGKEDRNDWLSGKEISKFAFPYEVELEAKEI